ncbi:hypothetical protein [Brevundimonas denitrificans]|uniref:hypothetical protein n=1 Tax=Brevundimonas denitrificans TaxID=1443434 RepID=UPI00223B34A9|nr:hypothetical protein [Brevundimonas denitrificans]
MFDSPGLEWLPSGLYSTRSIPVVKSLYPLWDNPELMREVKEGRYFLPGTATGERETLITSPLNAEPQYVARMPTPSPWHFWGRSSRRCSSCCWCPAPMAPRPWRG